MLLMALVLVSAVAEVVSLGAVLPFLTVLAAPQVAFGHPARRRLHQRARHPDAARNSCCH